jgi:hypothetical protein
MKRPILNQYYFILLILILSASVIALSAQGVTTSSLSGTVSDMAGEPLIGANVVAIHLPSGTVYGTSTDVDGTFNFANMRLEALTKSPLPIPALATGLAGVFSTGR